MPHHPTSRRSILILSSHYASNGFFPSVLPHQHPVCTSPVSHTCYMPIHLILINMTLFLTTALNQRWVFSLTVLHLYLRGEFPVANRREAAWDVVTVWRQQRIEKCPPLTRIELRSSATQLFFFFLLFKLIPKYWFLIKQGVVNTAF